MSTSDRLLLYARRLHPEQQEGMIRLGQSKSRVESAAIVEKRIYNEASTWNKNEERRACVYFGRSVIREKILACAIESMNRISSLPWTKQVCVMDTP